MVGGLNKRVRLAVVRMARRIRIRPSASARCCRGGQKLHWRAVCRCYWADGIGLAIALSKAAYHMLEISDGWSRKFEWSPWRARGPFPSLLTALQRNAPAEECCIAVVVVLVDVCATLLASMQRSSNFSSLLFVSNNLPFAMLMVRYQSALLSR